MLQKTVQKVSRIKAGHVCLLDNVEIPDLKVNLNLFSLFFFKPQIS